VNVMGSLQPLLRLCVKLSATAAFGARDDQG
jgi:hypothetical protein